MTKCRKRAASEPPMTVLCGQTPSKRIRDAEAEPTSSRNPHPPNSQSNSAPSEGHPNFRPHDYFDLKLVKTRRWKKAPVTALRYQIAIKKELESEDPLNRQIEMLEILRAAFNSILSQARQGSTAQVFISTNNDFYKSNIASRRVLAENLSFEDISEHICAILNSDESLLLQDITICLTTYEPDNIRVGARFNVGLYRRDTPDPNEFLDRSRFLEDPLAKRNRIPKDFANMCVPLALVKGLEMIESLRETPNLSKVKKQLHDYLQSPFARHRALQLVKKAGLGSFPGPFTISQIESLCCALEPSVRVNIFTDPSPPLYVFGDPSSKESINLVLMGESWDRDKIVKHAYLLHSDMFQAFLGTDKACLKCFKGYYDGSFHKCPEASCRLCQNAECENRDNDKTSMNRVDCHECDCYYHTQACFEAHRPRCEDMKRCKLCRKTIGKKKHECEEPFCQVCGTKHSPFDYCYVGGACEEGKPKPKRPIFYADIESVIDKDTKDHEGNLVIVQREDGQEYTYVSDQKGHAVDKFVHDCMKKGSPFKKGVIVFHNLAGYDGHLICKSLVRTKYKLGDVLKKGQKLMTFQMEKNRIEFRDSLLFLPGTPLSAFPKMFNLPTGDKGTFPFLLNTPKWVQFGQQIPYVELDEQGKIHKFPKFSYFLAESLSTDGLNQLKKWHQEQCLTYENDPSLVYIPEDELIKYCRQDVNILREGFTKFRESWLEEHPDIEPLDSCTFPSLNNRLFREKFMPPKSICLLPPQGFERSNVPQSTIAMAWLSYKQRELKLSNFRCARKGYEVSISGYHVDGSGKDEEGVQHVLEFHGCYYHGHSCQQPRTPELDLKAQRTEVKGNHLNWVANHPESPYGYFEYHSVYECEVREEAKHNPKLQQYLLEYQRRYREAGEGLKLRDALRGGRTNAVKHAILPVPEGYRLFYLDFTSLYPAVMYSINGEVYPTGMCEIFIGRELDEPGAPNPSNWFGFAKCEVLAPRSLLHPVLGQMVGSRQVFFLCTACAHNSCEHEDLANLPPCSHSEQERMIKGTFTTVELDLALKMGYQITKIHEVWHWGQEQRSRELFQGIIRSQYAKKALSSPVPADEKALLDLIREYEEVMDLELKKEEFKENKTARNIAKFSLNNLWGFFARRNDLDQTEFVTSYEALLELENAEDKVVKRVELCDNEEQLLVTYQPTTEKATRKGSVALAAFVTAYARIALYNVIAEYPEETAYFDTDSVFLLLPNDKPAPKTSTVLGGNLSLIPLVTGLMMMVGTGLKDEVVENYGAGASITSFCSLGPKAYSYTVENEAGETLAQVCRLKGIRFNDTTSQIITPQCFESLVKDHTRVEYTKQFLIKKDFYSNRLWSAEMTKRVQFMSRKRVIVSGDPYLSSLPFGYVPS